MRRALSRVGAAGQRGASSANARSFHIANVHAKTLRTVLVQNIDRQSSLATDAAPRFDTTGGEFRTHVGVNHKAAEYAVTKLAMGNWTNVTASWHSNTVENFFSIFKRARPISTATAANSTCATAPAK